jgi:hypothetical protein
MREFSNRPFDYANDVGPLYGVEHFSLFLYSLIRMQRPKFILELGSGSGVCALMSAAGLKQNGTGSILSLDDGSQWGRLSQQPELREYGCTDTVSHLQFLRNLARQFGLSKQVTFAERTFPDFPEVPEPIDILFVDYESQPSAIATILRHYLPKMNAYFSIFIDGASTYLPSFLYLERTVEQLRAGKIPQSLLGGAATSTRQWWVEFAATHTLNVIHLTKVAERTQNSTAWLVGAPVDHRPYPLAKMS